MKPITMNALFDKLSDLKTLFQFGQKIIPILQNLIDFMQETIPLLENINQSISESTSKIPKASLQINNVTSATELATTEILDLVDVISSYVSNMEGDLKKILEVEKNKTQTFEQLKVMLSDKPEALQLIESAFMLNGTKEILDANLSVIPKILNDVYSITLALQVQDITSQQLLAVNHLIESVQGNLAKLIDGFEETNIHELEHLSQINVPEGATYDPNAQYDHSDHRQKMADSIINDSAATKASTSAAKASQDEIDKLFS